MDAYELKAFADLNDSEVQDVNGGFAITAATVGSFAVKCAVTFVIRQGIKYWWNQTHGL